MRAERTQISSVRRAARATKPTPADPPGDDEADADAPAEPGEGALLPPTGSSSWMFGGFACS
jgi:hypothetical protein